MLETRTFFKTLPDKLKSSDYVAQVKIISTEIKKKRITKAIVIKTIKGKKRKTIHITSELSHSCNRDPKIEKGLIYFISGKINDKGIFNGVWKGYSQINSKSKKLQQ
jgi:hypothetical protein